MDSRVILPKCLAAAPPAPCSHARTHALRPRSPEAAAAAEPRRPGARQGRAQGSRGKGGGRARSPGGPGTSGAGSLGRARKGRRAPPRSHAAFSESARPSRRRRRRCPRLCAQRPELIHRGGPAASDRRRLSAPGGGRRRRRTGAGGGHSARGGTAAPPGQLALSSPRPRLPAPLAGRLPLCELRRGGHGRWSGSGRRTPTFGCRWAAGAWSARIWRPRPALWPLALREPCREPTRCAPGLSAAGLPFPISKTPLGRSCLEWPLTQDPS